MATAWKHTITLRKSDDGTPYSGLTVELYDGADSVKQGDYTDNNDGTYSILMTSIGSLVGTVRVNGLAQTEMNQIAIGAGGDVVDHLAASSAVHGVTGDLVGTTDSQSLTNKTLDSTNNIAAGAITAGTLAAARLPTGIADTKLAQLTTGDKVAGSAVELASNGGLEDSTGLKTKLYTYSGLELGASGLRVDAGDGIKINTSTGELEVGEHSTYFEYYLGLLTIKDDSLDGSKLNTSSCQSNLGTGDADFSASHFLTAQSTLTSALNKLDNTIFNLKMDTQELDRRAVPVYNQTNEATRDNATSVADDYDAGYFIADNSGPYLKVSAPFSKSALLTTLIVRGQMNNDDAATGSNMNINVIDSTGSQITTVAVSVTGTTWTLVDEVIDLSEEDDGIYRAEMDLKSGGGGGDAQVRALEMLLMSDSWMTTEQNQSVTWFAEGN